MKPAHLYMAGGAVALIALAWLLQSGNAARLGQAAGGAAVDLVVGVVGGAAGGVVRAADDPNINPLQPFGDWIGGTIFDLTH